VFRENTGGVLADRKIMASSVAKGAVKGVVESRVILICIGTSSGRRDRDVVLAPSLATKGLSFES
jgi:hypothetical protein